VICTVATKSEGLLIRNCDGIPEVPDSILGRDSGSLGILLVFFLQCPDFSTLNNLNTTSF